MQMSIEILVYHKCLSVYSAVHFNHISKTIMKLQSLNPILVCQQNTDLSCIY